MNIKASFLHADLIGDETDKYRLICIRIKLANKNCKSKYTREWKIPLSQAEDKPSEHDVMTPKKYKMCRVDKQITLNYSFYRNATKT